jgi:hypothetical protein
MNEERPVWHIGIIFVAGALLFIALVAVVKFSTTIPAIEADRAVVISKALADIHSAESNAINSVGWVDQSRGVVRLPIETAMQMVASDSPAALRAALAARANRIANTAPKVMTTTNSVK